MLQGVGGTGNGGGEGEVVFCVSFQAMLSLHLLSLAGLGELGRKVASLCLFITQVRAELASLAGGICMLIPYSEESVKAEQANDNPSPAPRPVSYPK